MVVVVVAVVVLVVVMAEYNLRNIESFRGELVQ